METLQISLALAGATALVPGLSPEAKAVEEAICLQTAEQAANPVAEAKPVDLLAGELLELWEECREDDWDGYGARGLDPAACSRAMRLLSLLSRHLPLPDLSAMPNGDVALDWDFEPRRSLTVTVSGSARIVWAAIAGDEESSGTVSFVSEFPAPIRSLIERLAR